MDTYVLASLVLGLGPHCTRGEGGRWGYHKVDTGGTGRLSTWSAFIMGFLR